MIDAEVELKRTTADRLIAYRSRSGAGGLRALAARCRGIHAETLHRMCMRALRRLKVETGSLACFGCGREHNCGIRGCAILRDAIALIEELTEDRSSIMMPKEDA